MDPPKNVVLKQREHMLNNDKLRLSIAQNNSIETAPLEVKSDVLSVLEALALK